MRTRSEKFMDILYAVRAIRWSRTSKEWKIRWWHPAFPILALWLFGECFVFAIIQTCIDLNERL